MRNKSLSEALLDGIAPARLKSIGTRESGFLSRFGMGHSTWSGKIVNVDTALQNDTVWSCVKLHAETVATLPLMLYRRSRDGAREAATDHRLYDVLHNQPNARMTAVSFWTAMSASMLCWGNAFAEVARNGRNEIVSLEFLLPSEMKWTWDANGNIEYQHHPAGGRMRPLPSSRVMHVRAFTLDGQIGLSAIQYGRNSIGSALAADQAADETFRDSSRATGVFTVDAFYKKDQRNEIREHIDEVGREGGVYVLEKGSTFHRIGFNPVDVELLQSRSFSVETICRWFRVPPVMIGHGDKQSSWPTSTEAQGALFLRYVLRSSILSIEQEIRRSLLSPAERLTYFAEYSLEGLLRGDSVARSAFYASALQNGWMTSNEVRRLENLTPAPGGDTLRVQSAMMSLEQVGAEPQQLPAGRPPNESSASKLLAALDTFGGLQ